MEYKAEVICQKSQKLRIPGSDFTPPPPPPTPED